MKRNPKDYIETFTGKKFWPFQPCAGEIELIDMVQGTSHECRYGGQIKHSWTILQHLLAMIEIAKQWGYGPYIQFICGTHDLGEGYLKDMPKPIKNYLPEFEAAGKILQDMIWRDYFKIRMPTQEELDILKVADEEVLYHEAIALDINKTDWVPFVPTAFKYEFKERLASDVRAEFMEKIYSLLEEIRNLEPQSKFPKIDDKKCAGCGKEYQLTPAGLCWFCHNN